METLFRLDLKSNYLLLQEILQHQAMTPVGVNAYPTGLLFRKLYGYHIMFNQHIKNKLKIC